MISEAERWEKGCQADAMRNCFVVPTIAIALEQFRPKRVLDVGAGTGYVARCIDARLDFRPEWTFVDLSADRLAMAEELRPAQIRLECVVGNVFDWPWEAGRFDALLITFTLLEIEDVNRLCGLIADQTADGSILVVTMPDAWIDVLQYATTDKLMPQKFLSGVAEIPKVDKFTYASYPFHARRIEDLIKRVLKFGFVLSVLEAGHTRDQRAFTLVFERRLLT